MVAKESNELVNENQDEPARTALETTVFHPIIVSRVDFMRIPGRRKTILGHIIPR